MTNTKIVAGLMVATCLMSGPAAAAGLLGGLVNSVTSTVTSLGSTPSGGSSGSTGSVVGSLLGGSSSGSGVSVPGVASVSSDSSGGTHINGSLLGGGGSTLNVGLGGVIGGTSNLGLTLPGTGNGAVDQTLGSVTGTVDGLLGNGGTVGSLLNDTGLSGSQGGLTGDGGLLGNDGGGADNSGGGSGRGAFSVDNGRGGRMVFSRYGANCIGPDPRAIGRLLQSRNYSPRTLQGWRRAANVQVVPVKLCPATRGAVRRQLSGNRSVGMVQTLAAADPLISTSLSRTRYGAGNVLAVDQAAGTLTVYVY